MTDDKPINAMYGSKMKLNLDKIKTNPKEDKKVESTPVEEVVEETESKVVENESGEEAPKEVAEEKPAEETAEEAPEEAAEEVVEEASEEKVVEETTDNKYDKLLSQIDNLKSKLDEKDNKLSNQSNELNYLTNKVIPKLKKEMEQVTAVKNELTNALEKSTKKYFDQLDINADLSTKIGKVGAESAVNKVRADKLEDQVNSIKKDLESKIDEYKDKLASLNVEDIKNENNNLKNEVKDLRKKLDASKDENSELYDEVNKLRAELIEIGNYKEEVDRNYNKEIREYKEEITSLKAQLKVKESSYDKLSNDSKRTISDLNNQVTKLEEALEKQSNRGLFDRFK